MFNGASRDSVNVYKIASTYFLNANEAARLYGGRVYWYPVSGRVHLSLRGRALQFKIGSAQVQVGGKKVRLDAPPMLRSAQAFLPLAFFEGEDFSSWAVMDTSFDPATKLLTLDQRPTVGGVRWFSYKERTRVSIELAAEASFKASARGVSGVEVSFPYGAIDSADRASISDGVVDSYSLTQGAKAAKLTVRFRKPGLQWKAKLVSKPRRMVLDVFKSGAEVLGDEPKPKSTRSISGVPSPHGKRRVVVDAGHGGKDPGASGARGTLEKDINLSAALELAKLLEQEGAFEVLLTRTNDTFVPLADRSRLANEFGADLFVSLHCNASKHPSDEGFEVYFMSETATDPAAQELADRENASVELEGKSREDVQAELLLSEMSKTENINAASELAALTDRGLGKRVDISDNGVKQASFYVLRGTHAPAILFEMAYITNKRDEAKLQSKKYRRKLVDGIYAGILSYAKRQGWLPAQAKESGT